MVLYKIIKTTALYAVTLTTCASLAIMQESGSDELSLFNPKGIYSFPLGDKYIFFTIKGEIK